MISTDLPDGRIQRFLHRHLEARDRSFFHQELNADVHDYNIPEILSRHIGAELPSIAQNDSDILF